MRWEEVKYHNRQWVSGREINETQNENKKNSIPNLKFAENLSSFYRPTKHHIIQIYTYL